MALIDKKNDKVADKDQETVKDEVMDQVVETKEEKVMQEEKNEVVVAEKKEVAKPVNTNASVFINDADLQGIAASVVFGDLPVITAAPKDHKVAGTTDRLGEVIEFFAVGANPVWKVSTGSKDEESKEYFKTSYEGPEELQAIVEEAIEDGYKKATVKEYLEVVATLTNCENADYIGELVVLQLSPSSIRSWKQCYNQCVFKLKMKAIKPSQMIEGDPESPLGVKFKSTSTPDTYNGNDFNKLVFKPV